MNRTNRKEFLMKANKSILVYGIIALSMMACNASKNAQQLTADGQNAVILADPVLVAAEPDPALVASCAKCHGVDGNGNNATFARLGAQSEEYFINEMRAYRDGTRTNKDGKMFMAPVAKKLTEQNIADLAHFYATRPAAAPIAGDAALIAQGAEIYSKGAGAVASCVACHGEKAEGKGSAARLAGQFPKEFAKQMNNYKTGDRKSDIMGPVGAALTPEQVAALAAYLGSL
jgi:cytochrome c553